MIEVEVTIRCDGCGQEFKPLTEFRVNAIRTARENGWQISEPDDKCPECRKGDS